MVKRKVTFKNIMLLQGIIMIYTISSVMAKFASLNKDVLIKVLFFLGLEFLILVAAMLLCRSSRMRWWRRMVG